MAPVDSSIETSSDAWATLVANIAPLLVLVGEKHVKEYLKTMSKPSHHLLFAAGPIGLVTAVTTLIRLKGAPALRRLIGRSFETRAEIFADVTGVSGGDVQFELKNEVLEQSTEPKEENVALFYIQGGMEGSVEEARDYWDRTKHWVVELEAERANTEVNLSHAMMGACVRARGNDALELLLKNVYTDRWSMDMHPTEFATTLQGTDDIDASVFAFGCFTDISLSLTANECVDGKRNDRYRFAISIFCMLANIGFVVVNWFRQENVQNTALIAAGSFLSALCSFYTAKIVNDMTEQKVSRLDDLGTFKSGFYSIAGDKIKLTFTPSAIVTSTAHPWTAAQHDFNWIAHGVIVFVVLGYISLYLGLRTAEWWVCLGILGISAASSVARALLSPDFVRATKAAQSEFVDPFVESLPPKPSEVFGFQNASCLQQMKPSGGPNTTTATPIPDDYSEIIFYWDWILNRGHTSILKHTDYKAFFRSVFFTVLKIRNRKLTIVEMTDPKRYLRSSRDTEHECLLYSDWLRLDGIVRQKLSIITPRIHYIDSTGNKLHEIQNPLNLWSWRASSKQQTNHLMDLAQRDPSLWIVKDNVLNRFGAMVSYLHSQYWRPVSVNALWMATKIALVSHADSTDMQIREAYTDVLGCTGSSYGWDGADIKRFGGLDLETDVIDFCLRAGLLVPSPGP